MVPTVNLLLFAVFMIHSSMVLSVQSIYPMTSSNCSVKSSEYYGGLFADCTGRNLQHVPPLEGNITGLDLSRNNITLQANAFDMFPFLIYLKLSSNGLKLLPRDVFIGISRLVFLDLTYNYLQYNYKSYPQDVFDPLKNLEVLNMGKNDNAESENYPDKIFRSLTNLKNISIDSFPKTNFGKGFGAMNNLRLLNLSGRKGECDIEELLNDTFSIFYSTRLLILDMTGCSVLKRIDANAFAPLTHLQDLNLGNTSAGLRQTLRALYGLLGRNMSSIILENIGLVPSSSSFQILQDRILDSNAVQYLSEICVSKLSLADNNIIYMNLTTLLNSTFLICLKYINFRHNSMFGVNDMQHHLIEFALKLNVEYVDVSKAYVHAQSGKSRPGKSYIKNTGTNTQPSSPEGSFINNYNSDTFLLPRKLRTLICDNCLAYAYVPNDRHNSFFNSNVLETISFSGFDEVDLEGTISGLIRLKTVKIAHNNRMRLSETFFDTVPSLQNLYLNDVGLPEDYFYKHGKRLFSRLSQLALLDLSGNRISRFPRGIFANNPKLETLLLSNNLFRDIPIDINDSPGMLFLDLSYNTIKYIDEPSRNELDSYTKMNTRFRLSLSGNKFLCFCNDVFFVFWLQQNNYTSDNRSQHACLTQSGVNVLIKDVNGEQLWQSCIGKSFFFVALTLTIFASLASVSFILAVKHKTQIKCFIMKLIRRGMAFPKREDFKFDLYLGYADDDYPHVYFALGKYLEDRLGYSVYVYNRDSIPGEDRATSILYGINNSWKTMFFMLQTLLDDEWSFYTMQAAVYTSSVLIPNRIILVKDQTNPCEIPHIVLCVVDEDRIVPSPNPNDNAQWEILNRLIK